MTFRRLNAFVALVISTTAVLIAISGCSAGYLLVVSSGSREVLRYNEKTGAFIDVFVPSLGGELESLSGLTFGPDRNLYVISYDSTFTATFDGQVLRYDGTTGAFIDVFVPRGSGGLTAPWALTFGPDCSLYVAGGHGDPDTGQVLRYQGLTGDFVDVFVPTGSGGLVVAGRLTFGPDGNLYVADHGTQQILRYDGATGAFLGVVVPATEGLSYPVLVFGPDGNLYVSFEQAGVTGVATVRRYNGSTGAFIDTFALGGGQKGPNHAMVFGPDGDLYATRWTRTSNPVLDSVVRYHGTTGAFIENFVAPASGGLKVPKDLAFFPRPVIKQIDTLLVAVENLRLPSDIEKSFKNPLQNARAAIDAGALLAARNQLDAYTNTVRINTGNLIPQPQANRLVIAANTIRDRLRCL